MFSYCRRVGKWFTVPVIEHLADDRPFRLRRLSALMLVVGWALFAAACLIGSTAMQVAGGALFSAGLASVYLYDRQDQRRQLSTRRGL